MNMKIMNMKIMNMKIMNMKIIFMIKKKITENPDRAAAVIQVILIIFFISIRVWHELKPDKKKKKRARKK